MVLLPNSPHPNGAASNQMVQNHLLKRMRTQLPTHYSIGSKPHSSCSAAHGEHSVKNFTVANTCVIKTELFKDK